MIFNFGKLAPAVLLIGAGVIGSIESGRRSDYQDKPLQFVHGPSGTQTRNDAELLNGWLDQVENSWEVGKNHDLVKSAFEKVVSEARQSTVRIFHQEKLLAMGTIVDTRGLIATKASEVAGRDHLMCRFADGNRLKAKIVGTVERHDFALLRVNSAMLATFPAVNLDPTITLEVGSIVATPSLEEKPVAIGIVSSGSAEIGSDAVLGIHMTESNQGALISEVLAGSAAETVGIKSNDVIESIDDKPVRRMRDAVELIGRYLPGQQVRFLVQRGGEKIEFSATLGRLADLDKENGDFQGYLGGELSDRRSGFPTVFQHDTFLLPTHCGGPVVDLQGRVVGINIARAERIASYALPAALVLDLVKELKPKTEDASNPVSSVSSTK